MTAVSDWFTPSPGSPLAPQVSTGSQLAPWIPTGSQVVPRIPTGSPIAPSWLNSLSAPRTNDGGGVGGVSNGGGSPSGGPSFGNPDAASSGVAFGDMTGPQAVATQSLNTNPITGLVSSLMSLNPTGALMGLLGTLNMTPSSSVANTALGLALGKGLGLAGITSPTAPLSDIMSVLNGISSLAGSNAISNALNSDFSTANFSTPQTTAEALGITGLAPAPDAFSLSPTLAAMNAFNGLTPSEALALAQSMTAGVAPSDSVVGSGPYSGMSSALAGALMGMVGVGSIGNVGGRAPGGPVGSFNMSLLGHQFNRSADDESVNLDSTVQDPTVTIEEGLPGEEDSDSDPGPTADEGGDDEGGLGDEGGGDEGGPSDEGGGDAGAPGDDGGGGGGSGGGDGGSASYLCTEMHRRGYMDETTWALDSQYTRLASHDLVIGYRAWAGPLSRLMRRSALLSWLLSPLILAWSREMVHRMGATPRGSVVGRAIFWFGTPLCEWLGRSMRSRAAVKG